MKYLLDTHTFLWWMSDDDRLSARVLQTISEHPEEVVFSAVSGWEMAIKVGLGKLEGVPLDDLADEVTAQGWTTLPFGLSYVTALASLPHHHRDPFDRALIAQALVEDLTFLTRDPRVRAYDVRTLW